MIKLFTDNTPNGKKISIMLEECSMEYEVIKVDISNGDQFKDEFKKISPFSKIPVIQNTTTQEYIFESGVILMYLGEINDQFYPKNNRLIINQWLMAQMAFVGPMLGQHHQFHHYHPGKSEFGEKRYFEIAHKVYTDLDARLKISKFLAGDEYTIADIATFPWIARHDWHDIGLHKFIHLKKWFENISERPAVLRGYDYLKKGETPPEIKRI